MESQKENVVVLGLFVASLLYISLNPPGVPCVGCDTGGLFYKCMEGTGAGSFTCDAFKRGMQTESFLTDGIVSAGDYTKELSAFATRIPGLISEFAKTLAGMTKKVFKEIVGRVGGFADRMKEYVAIFYQAVKDGLISTWEDVMRVFICPVLGVMVKYVVEPLEVVVQKLMALVKMILEGVDTAMEKTGEIVSTAYNATEAGMEKITEGLEWVLDKVAKFVMDVVDTLESGLNAAMKGVTGGVRKSVLAADGALKKVSNLAEDAVNGVIGGVEKAVEGTVNGVGEGISKLAGGVETTVNKSMSAVVETAEKAVDGMAGGTETAVNVVLETIANGLDGTLDSAESLVNTLGSGIEVGVNTGIKLLNVEALGKIQVAFNAVTGVVSSISDFVYKKVLDKIVSGWNKAHDWELKFKVLRKTIKLGKPLNKILPEINHDFSKGISLDAPKIPPVPLLDIPPVNFPDVEYRAPQGASRLAGERISVGDKAAIRRALDSQKAAWKQVSQGCASKVDYSEMGASYMKKKGLKGRSRHRGARLGRSTKRRVRMNIAGLKKTGGPFKESPVPDLGRRRKAAVPGGLTIPGLSIPRPDWEAPTITVPTPDIEIDLDLPQVDIKAPDFSELANKIDWNDFNIPMPDITGKIPDIPNPITLLGEAFSQVGKLMDRLMEPIWRAYAEVMGLVCGLVTMLAHLFTNVINWQKIRELASFIFSNAKRVAEDLRDMAYLHVYLPLKQIMTWIKKEVISFASSALKRVKELMSDVKSTVFEAFGFLWKHISPVFKEVALTTAGIGMFSLSSALDRLPPFSWIPGESTGKVMLILSAALFVLFGVYGQFILGTGKKLLEMITSPIVLLDHHVEKRVLDNWDGLPGTMQKLLTLLSITPETLEI